MAIRQLKAYEEFIEFITSLPTLEAISQYTLSSEAQARISTLLEANRNRRLMDAEVAELDDYQEVSRMVRRAKIRALAKLAELNKMAPTSS